MQGPTIEFIDVAPADAPVPDDPRPIRNRRVAGLFGIGAVLAALLLIGSAVSTRSDPVPSQVSEDVGSPTTQAVAESTDVSTPSTVEPRDVDSGQFVPWPDPPDDFAPTVIGRPGPDTPVFGEITETAVVYVNALGRPTVVDLDTGWIEQVEIAPTRSYDYFGVEFGRVVSFDGRNGNVREATDRSLLFHVHRAGSVTTVEDFRASASPAPHLCLSTQTCPIDRWTFERTTNGTDTIRVANATDDPDVLEMLFGDSWTEQRGTRLPPESLGLDIRVPAPQATEAWIIHQPGSEAWRRMTRVN